MAFLKSMALCLVMLCATVKVDGLIVPPQSTSCGANLSPAFYSRRCPRFLSIVRQVVVNQTLSQIMIPARLIRLMFHDCMAVGCDASVLLKSIPNIRSERDAEDNRIFGLMTGGYPTITKIKEELEEVCPRRVSCADIVVAAAVEGLRLVNPIIAHRVGARYGRRDSVTSFEFNADFFLPHQWHNPSQVRYVFQRVGLIPQEYVALIGAHTMGTANCWRFYERLGAKFDTRLDPEYAQWLNTSCVPPVNGTGGKWPWIPLDNKTSTVFDNQFFKNVLNRRGLLSTDSGLLEDIETAYLVNLYASDENIWYREFAKAFKKLSELNVLTGLQGEIRNNCDVVNQGYVENPTPLG